MIARDEQYLIAKPDDDRPLVGQVDGYTDASARQAVERLEHIERWKTTAELDNPATSIGPDELQVEILQDGKPLTGSEHRLEYTRGDGDEWINPEVTIRLKNTGKRTLYVGLLDLPQTFGIFPMLSRRRLPEAGARRGDVRQRRRADPSHGAGRVLAAGRRRDQGHRQGHRQHQRVRRPAAGAGGPRPAESDQRRPPWRAGRHAGVSRSSARSSG